MCAYGLSVVCLFQIMRDNPVPPVAPALSTTPGQPQHDNHNRFAEYAGLVQDKLMPKYGATWHWAKIEPPADPQRLDAMRAALAARFPLDRFNAHRARLDPDGILGNRLLDSLLIGGPQGSRLD